jgi:hypothetical protein
MLGSSIGALLASTGSLIETLEIVVYLSAYCRTSLLVALIAIGWTKKSAQRVAQPANFEWRQSQAETLWEHYNKKPFGGPPCFYFVGRPTPTSDGAFFYFMTDDLHLGPEFMGRINLLGRPLVLAPV